MSIIVYSKPNCVQCNATHRALKKKNVDYTVIDVTEDHAAYQHVASLGYQQVPVVETEHDHWSGYRPDKIAELANVYT